MTCYVSGPVSNPEFFEEGFPGNYVNFARGNSSPHRKDISTAFFRGQDIGNISEV